MTSSRSNKISRSVKRATTVANNSKCRVSAKQMTHRLHYNDDDDGPSTAASPAVRVSRALQTMAHCNAARLALAQAELTLSKVVVPTLTITSLIETANCRQCHHSSSTTTLPVLSPAARALVASKTSTTVTTIRAAEHRHGEENEAADATDDSAAAIKLENVLRRATITNPQTVQCMIDGLQQSQKALRELAPCRMTLEEFQSLVVDNHRDDNEPSQQQQAKLLYSIVREALTQCEDLQDYYQTCPSFACRHPTLQRFSARTLPPFVDGYPHEPLLNELSDRYWECESQIQRLHRRSSHPIQPGFTSEMVAILCHGYEVGWEPSPIGLNLFNVVAV